MFSRFFLWQDDMMKQLKAKRDEQVAARGVECRVADSMLPTSENLTVVSLVSFSFVDIRTEKSEQDAFAKTKRSHRAMSRPAVSSSSSSGSESSDGDESDSDDSDDSGDGDVQRKLQELKNKKRRGFAARAL